MTLYDLYMGANDNTMFVDWKIYGEKNKLICPDYGSKKTNELDNLIVKNYMWSKNREFIKVYVHSR